MFGTLGFSELIIILAIILIIFGAGRLPQIGEGLGKALKGFKKEVHDVPPPDVNSETESSGHSGQAAQAPAAQEPRAGQPGPVQTASQPVPPPARPATAPYQPGPEMTPGTTASLLVSGLGPQQYEPPKPKAPAQLTPTTASAGPPIPTMEERLTQPAPSKAAAYPAAPAAARPKAAPKRPSAIVNKAAVARVQAQQAALRAKSAQQGGLSPQDMQGLGESLGDALRTFRQAASDVRNSIDPEMRTIQAEMDAAHKEIEQSIEAAKQLPNVQEDPPKSS
jgi:TatA/E family protein of Tat protein translocase